MSRGFRSRGTDFSTDYGKNVPQDNYHFGRLKQAVYYDVFCKQVTVEQGAGLNNGNYSEMIDLLRVVGIRYREVKRYTINPDRICIDILVTQDDLEKVEKANKDYKDTGITLQIKDTISEGVYPKVVTKEDKE